MKNIRVLVVGLGNMGLSHARAYDAIDGFAIAGFWWAVLAAIVYSVISWGVSTVVLKHDA